MGRPATQAGRGDEAGTAEGVRCRTCETLSAERNLRRVEAPAGDATSRRYGCGSAEGITMCPVHHGRMCTHNQLVPGSRRRDRNYLLLCNSISTYTGVMRYGVMHAGWLRRGR